MIKNLLRNANNQARSQQGQPSGSMPALGGGFMPQLTEPAPPAASPFAQNLAAHVASTVPQAFNGQSTSLTTLPPQGSNAQSFSFTAQSQPPPSKTYGVTVQPTVVNTGALVPYQQTIPQPKVNLTAPATNATVGLLECNTRDMFTAVGISQENIVRRVEEIEKRIGYRAEAPIVVNKDTFAQRSVILVNDSLPPFEHPLQEVRDLFKSKYDEFLQNGLLESTAHKFAVAFATKRSKAIEAEVEARDESKRKSQLQAQAIPPPAPPVFDDAVWQNIKAFTPADAELLKWAKALSVVSKGAKKLNKTVQSAYELSDTLFGYVYYLQEVGGNPFEVLDPATEAAFVQWKVTHGFPADTAWDGAKP